MYISFFSYFFLAHKEVSSRISAAFNNSIFLDFLQHIYNCSCFNEVFSSWQGNFLLHEAEKWLHEKIDNLSNLQQLAYKYTFCRAGWLQVGKWVNNGTFSHCTAIHNVPCVSCLSDTTDDTSLQLSRISKHLQRLFCQEHFQIQFRLWNIKGINSKSNQQYITHNTAVM